ncbi:hypothetical protein J2Y45_006655 [Dyadobacter sp. BE34]|uniref:DUF2652 domain-containing protein n=1 Tax=Dyadobacter fermentans TaxID=94254 RepID=A0ABU1R7V6_9BACT|nr:MULTISPECIES: DUF2652 domain-containing protein [Dyadobacter]MDR6809489.1 hypothetical protein [Dyadobacter fermentans]MDR7047255.1 hypothetical protein [Dyadobacter sp. BE242]MDR7201491.1 hypothetical protein [Dyadobacter sp. BE34]MDR7219361.1 hypothetical protein [Dyadobacter sp. BE31]MDR7267127.1 hypothetical protein [Dyadobacter sp. BE32]
MENKGLIFIPDISGFTRFMHEIEIQHGRQIIQELLETIVNANQMGLEISEIEGDAILFFKFGEAPELETLYRQVEKMFCDFHQYIIAYDNRRFCQCKSCISAVNLTLKVVAHYGEFTTYQVKNFRKLIGKDIIVAHQLLKNDIDQHEYWLVTQNLLNGQKPDGFTEWMQWYPGSKTTENEQIPFQYTQIGPLKDSIPPYTPPLLEPREKVQVLLVAREYDANIKKVFFTSGHLELRSRWQDGLKSIEELDHFLPGIGSRHRCIREDGETVMYASGFSYDPETRIVFSESDEKLTSTLHFVLEKLAENRTRLSLEYYLKRDPLKQLAFRLFKKDKMEEEFRKSLANLEQLLPEITLPIDF